MSLSSVKSALVSAYRDTAIFSDSLTAYDNFPFDPPSDAEWARVTFIPNQPEAATQGDEGSDFVDGFVQVDLFAPIGKGDSSILAKFETLRATFKAGTALTYSGQAVTIRSCGRSAGNIENGYFRISAQVNFYAFLSRA